MIKQYLDGKLDPSEMHKLEKQALEDPFLSDALEGYKHVSFPGPQLSLLQMQLEERIAQQHENKNNFYFSWQRLSIAATAGVLLVLATILFWMKFTPATGGAKQVEVTLSPLSSSVRTAVQPEGGWGSYQKYLKQNLKVGKLSGQVEVQFQIASTGVPENFKVIRGLNEAADKEAVRLIREGPKWTTSESGITETTLTINFSE